MRARTRFEGLKQICSEVLGWLRAYDLLIPKPDVAAALAGADKTARAGLCLGATVRAKCPIPWVQETYP